MHGPWGNDCTDVHLSIIIPSDITSCQVSWTSWVIDSRDDEVDRVLIDDVEVWSAAAQCWGSAGDGWELGPEDFSNAYGGQAADQVCLAENVVVVDCSTIMTIDFLSGIDQGEDDESWAFSNVQVIGSNGETVILDETHNTANGWLAGWSNSEITNVGSAGNVHGPWGNDVRDVTLEVRLPEDNAFCEVSWRQWAIDSRDNEVDSVTIDGEEVWSMAINCPDQGCGRMGWEEGPEDFPAPWGGSGGACFDEIKVQVPCEPPTLTINFSSGIDQGEADESWAFSDVRIVGRPELPSEGDPSHGGH
eukprot:SAG11_NODE_1258_length_5362_cov_16.457534_4_plen_304_part_00